MNILFDINHPAHVHLFRNAIKKLNSEGHNITVVSRDKDITKELLDGYKIPHKVLSKAGKGLLWLGFELVWRQLRLLPILIRNKIQICVSVTGASVVHICALLRIPTLVFYDTEHAKLQNNLTIPFATKFITPDSFKNRYGKKHITYNGFHDLAYLHPNYFTADRKIFELLNLGDNERFIIIRFVSWQASHDKGEKGIGIQLKRKIIETCREYAKVFIVSEASLGDDLKEYKFPLSPNTILDALSCATMYIGEGGSMATEAAILGTPSIFISSLNAGVFEELENKYELMYSFKPNEENEILQKIEGLLQDDNIKETWNNKRNKLLNEKINVTEFIASTILQYQK